MKAAIFLLAAAGAALAQDISGQPECATACISSAISAAGCEGDDIGCQCGPTQAAIVAGAAPCLIESCSQEDLARAQSAGEVACSSFSESASATDGPEATTTSGGENPEETSTDGGDDGEDNTTDDASTTDGAEEPSTTEMVTTTTTDDAGNTVTTEVPEDTSTAGAAIATPALLGVMGVLGVVAAL